MFGFGKPAKTGFETIDGAEAATRVEQGAALIDVREPDEYAAGHIAGAVNVPLSRFASEAHRIPAGRPAILYCAAGMRSERALGVCANLGLDVKAHVGGGISALARAGMAVRRG